MREFSTLVFEIIIFETKILYRMYRKSSYLVNLVIIVIITVLVLISSYGKHVTVKKSLINAQNKNNKSIIKSTQLKKESIRLAKLLFIILVLSIYSIEFFD